MPNSGLRAKQGDSLIRALWRRLRCKHEWELAYGPYGDRFLMCDKCRWAK